MTDSRSYTSLVPELLLKNRGLGTRLHERRLFVPDFVLQPGRISHVIWWHRRVTAVPYILEPRLSVLNFVLQLWRKIVFSPKLRDKIQKRKAWV